MEIIDKKNRWKQFKLPIRNLKRDENVFKKKKTKKNKKKPRIT